MLKKLTTISHTISVPDLKPKDNPGANTIPYPHAFKCCKEFLKNMLKVELEAINNNPNSTSPIASLVHQHGPSVIVMEFCDQIYAYAKHKYPFN
jgi:hypothetical protein